MAARHPASQRAPPSQHADHRDRRHEPAHRPRAHHRRGSSASHHSSDADHHGGPTLSPRSSAHPSVIDHHSRHRPASRPYSQTSSHAGDGPHDSSSEDNDGPRRHLRSSRHTTGTTGTRHGPAEAVTHSQHGRPAESVDEETLGPHHPSPRCVTQQGQGDGAGQGRGGQVEEHSFRSGTRRESTRAVHEGVRAGMRSFDDPNNRVASGTDPLSPQSPQHPPRRMPAEDPYVPEPGSAMHQHPLPVYQFNRDRYPAYDVHARRIGLEHVRNESSVPQPGQYYRARTHTYPGPNVSAADYPHVMNIDLDVAAPIPPETGSGSQSRVNRLRTSSPHRNTSSLEHGHDHKHNNTNDDLDIPRRDSPSPMPGHYGPRSVDADEDIDQERGGVDADHLAEAEADGPPINSTPYLRTMLGLGPEDEVSLNALADPPEGEKPNYPYPTLIKLAIHGSRNKRLTLQDIYQALEDRFEWYRVNANDKSWQNSIRHNLSLNKCFRRVPRPITEPGKGSFWTVDYSQGTGNKRERKRNKKPTKAQLRKMAEEEARAVEGRDDMASPVSAGGSTASQHVPRSESSRGGVSPAGDAGHGSPTVECSFSNPSRSSSLGTPAVIHSLSDAHIDPALRDQGHVVGEGRTWAGHDLTRRRSSGVLPPVQIRQSARVPPRPNTYDSSHSRSPSPRPPSSSRATNPTFVARPPGVGRPVSAIVPSQHTFGRGSMHVGVQPNQYTWPSPANWERYGQNLQPPLSAASVRQPPPPSNNALLLSGVPNSNVAGPSSYATGPSNAPPPRSAPRPEASSSRLPVSNYREGVTGARRTSNRRVYTDSRGNEYPAQGDSYSSASE